MATKLFQLDEAVFSIRGVHLDLKGLPPAPEHWPDLLKVIAAARYNALLVEWEDVFPWTVDERFRSPMAYTAEQVRDFHDLAASLGLAVIPLVQCLGHLETPLSLPDYAHLREVPAKCDVLNPLAAGARDLVQRMVDDVLAATPGARRLHLGGDEAWSFGTHPDTKAYIERHGKGALYMHHVEPILKSLNERGVRPILWHDMMIHWEDEPLRRLAELADLCVWGYTGHPDATNHHYNSKHTERFRKLGVTCWAGTAYKGADGQDADLTNLANRQANALAWAEVGRRFEFVGAFATAWSRYATGRNQCAPIDACLDSLVNVGVILHDGMPPAGGAAACLEALADVGEAERFQHCRDALAHLHQFRMEAWDHIRILRQLLALLSLQPERYSTQEAAVAQLRRLQQHREGADAARRMVAEALDGLVQPLDLEHYLAERLLPLATETTELAAAVQRACAAYLAAEK